MEAERIISSRPIGVDLRNLHIYLTGVVSFNLIETKETGEESLAPFPIFVVYVPDETAARKDWAHPTRSGVWVSTEARRRLRRSNLRLFYGAHAANNGTTEFAGW